MTMGISLCIDYWDITMFSLVPIMIDHNVSDLLVLKSLSYLNMWNRMIGSPGLMITKFSDAFFNQCILLPQFGNYLLFLGLCHCIWIFSGQSWFYLYALPNYLWFFYFCPTVIQNTFMCFLLWLMWFWKYPTKNITGPILIIRTCSWDGA
jgi:hypothetical protein